MKQLFSLILSVFFPLIALANPALKGLTDRVIPKAHQNSFVLSVDDKSSGNDSFTLSSINGKISIIGNSPVSVAFGLNWYMKYHCMVSDSWCGKMGAWPKKLPIIKEPLTIKTPLKTGFYLNYCTFSYSMPFWDWADWEREIDRMALNGITSPMAMVGVEAVWMETLLEFNYSRDEIKKFLPGPAYMGWFLMGNLEGMGGPMSDTWIERQRELGVKIANRMRELGMDPVFQSFFGMVPTNFAEKYFEADIVAQGKWQNYDRPAVLNPIDPLFADMAKVWYEKYQDMFGTTKYWAGDLFHEGGKSGNMDVETSARAVQEAMQASVPDAIWVIQSWGGNPRKDLLKGLDRQKTLIVDLCAEYWDRWNERGGFEGTPWVWGNITNWGGNIGLHGRLDAVATEPMRAKNDPVAGPWLRGTANVPEGIGTNPVVFDLACEMRWRDASPKLPEWLHTYACYRYGKSDATIDLAWDIFYKTAYGTHKGHRRPSESYLCARPSLNVRTVSAWGSAAIYYEDREFADGVRKFASVASKFVGSDAYKYDLVDFTRQVVANNGRNVYNKIIKAYKENKSDSLKIYCSQFMELLDIQDQLLSTRPELSLSTWIEKARAAGSTDSERDQFEYNARALITTWSAENSALVDYAHREWSGLLRDYYAPRWKTFFDWMAQTVGQTNVKAPTFTDFEQRWAHDLTQTTRSQIDLMTVVNRALNWK